MTRNGPSRLFWAAVGSTMRWRALTNASSFTDNIGHCCCAPMRAPRCHRRPLVPNPFLATRKGLANTFEVKACRVSLPPWSGCSTAAASRITSSPFLLPGDDAMSRTTVAWLTIGSWSLFAWRKKGPGWRSNGAEVQMDEWRSRANVESTGGNPRRRPACHQSTAHTPGW